MVGLFFPSLKKSICGNMEKIIRDSLTDFIQSHIPEADFSAMDEVFFSYITSVLEELGSPDASEDNFDMETFMEMMEGYTPGFAKIDSMEVYEMMFELTRRLRDAGNTENSFTKTTERVYKISTNCSKEHGGNAEGKILPPAEGASAQTMPVACVSSKGELKDIILQKYMLVDDEEDKRTHRPVAPKEAPKKLVRYIDNQVVSIKGERYKDLKKPESEEMKKTYINLKPARKYKFH
uniref:CUE domain-containing protein 2 isoform X2 n=1 Tax=Geotrypetes seraphini TaxID=260995 RepID=A0A6P8REY5_GEOSA|nr:CUE domain-containing protein 2 isoform X2 [Geotrypetes seraphini]